jgi:hypothetical protein
LIKNPKIAGWFFFGKRINVIKNIPIAQSVLNPAKAGINILGAIVFFHPS